MTGAAHPFDAFAGEWVAAFNAHDLPRILSHYHPAIELVSPIYRAVSADGGDTVRGLAALEGYFAAALARYPALHFTLLEVAHGTRGPCLRYRSSLGGRIAMEAFELEGGRARRVLCHYVGAALPGGPG